MGSRCRAMALGLGLGLAACGHHDDEAVTVKVKSQAGSSLPLANAASGSASGAPAVFDGIEVFVDDKSAARVSLDKLGDWPRLDVLLPVSARRLGTWQDLVINGIDEPKRLHKPSDTYRDLVPAVYVGDGGAPAFGMFDPVELAKHGKPQLGAMHVHDIHITLAQGGGRGENESGDGGGTDPTQLKIAIKTPAGSSTLDGTKLLAIPREPIPGDDANDPRGWSLSKLMDAAGIKKFQKVMLTDISGQALSLEPADFDAKTSVPFVKLNRQGMLRVTVYKKQGEGWQRAGDLRGLASIEVLK